MVYNHLLQLMPTTKLIGNKSQNIIRDFQQSLVGKNLVKLTNFFIRHRNIILGLLSFWLYIIPVAIFNVDKITAYKFSRVHGV